jgi:hypothetical protein
MCLLCGHGRYVGKLRTWIAVVPHGYCAGCHDKGGIGRAKFVGTVKVVLSSAGLVAQGTCAQRSSPPASVEPYASRILSFAVWRLCCVEISETADDHDLAPLRLHIAIQENPAINQNAANFVVIIAAS